MLFFIKFNFEKNLKKCNLGVEFSIKLVYNGLCIYLAMMCEVADTLGGVVKQN